jgi:uncharacterized damage-inducible protein DinB
MKRPETNEYSDWYAGYVSLVQETDIISALENQIDEFKDFFSQISDEKALYAYAEGKWTIKELLGHINDGERVFAYRALRFGRNDATELAGFDENPYVQNANFNERNLADLLEEFILLRKANLFLFRNFKETDWNNFGIASEAKITVRALVYIMVGHARHHIKILKERYLNN